MNGIKMILVGIYIGLSAMLHRLSVVEAPEAILLIIAALLVLGGFWRTD